SIASPASPRRIISAEWFDAAPSIPPAREIFHNGDVIGSPPSGPPVQRDVKFPIGAGLLDGTLAVPRGARGLVVFAHGSGSSRLSPRNRFVAERLQNAGLATLLTDLLTVPEEERDQRTGRLRVEKELAIVPGATHLFEESGTLEQVADLAAGWFQRYLVPNP